MTDGTSQGLFIVVAIVIFGIFVVLAYILFEDTLSPAMASMFNDAIEQAEFNASNTTIIGIADLEVHGNPSDYFEIHTRDRSKIIFSSRGNSTNGSGVAIPSKFLEPDKKYRWTFDLKVLEGQLFRLGGHSHISSTKVMTIDGEPFNYTANMVTYDFENNKTYRIDMDYIINRMVIDEFGNKFSNTATEADLYIQPNRTVAGQTPFKIELSNMRFIEVK